MRGSMGNFRSRHARHQGVYWIGDGELVIIYNPETGEVRRLRGALAKFWVSMDEACLEGGDPEHVRRLLDEGWVVGRSGRP